MVAVHIVGVVCLPNHWAIKLNCPLHIFCNYSWFVNKLSLHKVVVHDLNGLKACKCAPVIKTILSLT
jgi:hypothetical protein